MSKAISIDISDASVEVVDLRHLFSATTIKGIGRQLLPKGIIVDGVIQDMESLAGHIRTACKNAQPSSIDLGVIYGAVPESKVFTHVFSFPRDLGKRDIEQAILLQFSEYFPFEIEEVYVDWDIVQETEQTRMVLVGATEKIYVDQMRVLAKAIGAQLGSVDIESISTARAIVPVPDDQHAVMMVDIGARVTSLSIFDSNALHMTHALDIGGYSINEAIAKKKDVVEDVAEQMKRSFSLLPNADDPNQVGAIVHSHFKPVLEEINRVRTFYEGNYRKTITEIVVCGGVSLMEGMDTYITNASGLPTSHGNALSFIKNSDIFDLSKEESLLFANVIGLSLGQLSRQFKQSRFNFLEKKK